MQLNFPTYNFKVKKLENRNYIFDSIRKKYVVLTPEEWVRQHLIMYLTTDCQCPATLIAVEKGLLINGLQKRFDVVVYNKSGKPSLIAECKAPNIAINSAVFSQAAIYNQALKAPVLVVTNGLETISCKYNSTFSEYHLFASIPVFPFE